MPPSLVISFLVVSCLAVSFLVRSFLDVPFLEELFLETSRLEELLLEALFLEVALLEETFFFEEAVLASESFGFLPRLEDLGLPLFFFLIFHLRIFFFW